MANRQDLLVQLIRNMDRRIDQDDNEVLTEVNVDPERFYPISEKLQFVETVELSYYTYADQVWGNGGETTKLETLLDDNTDWSTATATNVTLTVSGFVWGNGGETKNLEGVLTNWSGATLTNVVS